MQEATVIGQGEDGETWGESPEETSVFVLRKIQNLSEVHV